jgi:hypothetical protein
MMKWFRFYNEVLDDPKVQKLHPALFKHWVNLLCLASEMGDAGDLPNEDAIAFRLRVRTTEVRKILDQLVAAGLLDFCENDAESRRLSAHNWQGRQRSSDNSAARVARHRAANEEKVTLQTPLPKRKVDTDSDTDTEVEKKNVQVRSKKPASYSPEFEEFWAQYPSGHGSKKETFKRIQQLNPDAALWAEIMTGLAAWHRSEKWVNGFIKAAEAWVSQELWTNPAPPARTVSANGRASAGKQSAVERSLAEAEKLERMVSGTYEPETEHGNVVEPEWSVIR